MIAPPFVSIINHLLRGASWAPRRLAPFARRNVRVISGPLVVQLAITAEGLVAAATGDSPADLVIDLPPFAAARLLAGDRTAQREARVNGDQELAQAVAGVVDQLHWDVEEDLSLAVGDLVAHRLMDSFRTLAQWQRAAAESIARNAAEFWTEEDPLIASRHRVGHFIEEVDQLRDDVERLSKRVDLVGRALDS